MNNIGTEVHDRNQKPSHNSKAVSLRHKEEFSLESWPIAIDVNKIAKCNHERSGRPVSTNHGGNIGQIYERMEAKFLTSVWLQLKAPPQQQSCFPSSRRKICIGVLPNYNQHH
jgi:hypothetical protein